MSLIFTIPNNSVDKLKKQLENFAYNACPKIYGHHNYVNAECSYCGQPMPYIPTTLDSTKFKNMITSSKTTTGTVTFVNYMYDASKLTKLEYDLSENADGTILAYSNPSDTSHIYVKPAQWVSTIELPEDSSKLFSFDNKIYTFEGLDTLSTKNVTNMSSMFSGLLTLANVDEISEWDVSNVENVEYMFTDCSELSNIDGLSNWTISARCQSLTGLFTNCAKLTNINGLSKFIKYRAEIKTMESTFEGCTALTDISVLSNITWGSLSAVTRMNSMFLSCSSLSDINPLKKWRNITNKLEDISSMFADTAVTDATCLNIWGLSSKVVMTNAFPSGCATPTWYTV